MADDDRWQKRKEKFQEWKEKAGDWLDEHGYDKPWWLGRGEDDDNPGKPTGGGPEEGPKPEEPKPEEPKPEEPKPEEPKPEEPKPEEPEDEAPPPLGPAFITNRIGLHMTDGGDVSLDATGHPDIFVVSGNGNSTATIYNFNPAEDKIQLPGNVRAQYDSDGGNTVIEMSGGYIITLVGVNHDDVDGSIFLRDYI